MARYSFEEMRRTLVCGWGEAGGRTAAAWLEFNERLFGGRLEALPIFFTPIGPYARKIGWCHSGQPMRHIALCRPKTGNPAWSADRCTLLHEMLHAWLDQRGLDPKHAGEPWRAEIMRLHYAITGRRIVAGKSRVTKVVQPDGTRKSVRVQDGDLGQEAIAAWPHSCGIDLGPL